MNAPLPARSAVVLVARREFVTQVRSRSFVIGILITLVFFAGMFLLGSYISGQTSSHALGVTPQAAGLRPVLEQTAHGHGVELDVRQVDEAPGREQVRDGELDALLTGAPGAFDLVGHDSVDGGLQAIVQAAVEQQAVSAALAGAGVDPAQVASSSALAVTTLEPFDSGSGQRLAIAFVGTLLLFFSLSGYGNLVATGVVEEKQSRVVELLLATITPWQLLAGKVIGLGAVGLLQLVILSAIAGLGAAAAGLLVLPGAALGMFVMVVLWYLLGFFLYASLYAAVGSTVSRQEELQSVVAPMIFLLLIPFILTVNLLPSDPRNGLAAVLSFVPFFSQTVMPARYALGVASLGEVLVAAALAAATIVVVVRVAGRIYRNSVLRTGARVSLREALTSKSS
ncbi:ABC-2 type transport system permease protein [Pseudonocardia hierapolitana]|uniref:ABC-2 type transport system permease protein n=1 Tax=Pseudonocardia hierapolitana TaxID=1128676 RepID=A0A561SPJ0_9PSEU|nr:ABC transporter permease [Pseudonocardia hierapolitana]TWF76757.1 ABC-2 type transport system permease protein [Pseudonocardia hierapolitana]